MQLGDRSIQAHGQPREARALQFGNGFGSKKRGGAGRHGRMEAMGHSAPHYIKNVRTLQGIAAGKNKDRWFQLRYIADQLLRFQGAQLQWVPFRLGACPAVKTGKVASLRGFPDHNQWILIQVKTRIHFFAHP